MSAPRWIVSQIGAREHYAVPRGLHRLGLLDRLYTDAWCYSGASLLQHGPPLLRRFAGRRSDEIPGARVTAFNRWAWREALRPAAATNARHQAFIRVGQEFARRVARELQKHLPQAGRDVFLGFDTGSLETLEWLKTRDVFSIVDQIDPALEGEVIAQQEAQRWTEWDREPSPTPDSYFARLSAEWNAASLVVVNSAWSRGALLKQGVPAGKVVVVPCAYDPPTAALEGRPIREGPLRVLWLGAVNLRKGIPYLLDAARLLGASAIRVRVVGTIGISREAVESAPANVTFEGPVPRAQIGAIYREADLFVFPTLSDGFGMTQLEAMSHGLPVVATPNCGEVVSHEQDGLIVPAGDGPALAAAIARLDADRPLLAEMSRQAPLKVRQFSIERVTRVLLERVAAVR